MEMQITGGHPAAPPIPQPITEDVQLSKAQGAGQGGQGASGQVPQATNQGSNPASDTSGANPQPETNASGEDPKDETGLSARFAALAKREKVLVDREKKAQEAVKKYEPLIQKLSEFKENPISALEAIEAEGITFEMLAQAYIAKKDPNHKPTTEDQYAVLQKRLDAMDAEKQTNAQKAEEAKAQAVIDGFKGQINSILSEGGDKYELVQAQNAIDVVYDVIEQHFQATGEILAIDVAADKVENYLYEEGKRLLSIKKFGHQPTPVAPVPAAPKTAAEAIAKGAAPKPSHTLSTQDVTTSAPAETSKGLVSREESIRRSAAKLVFKQ